jgi:hypothetical protein
MWGALSVEKTGVSFTIAAAPRQCIIFTAFELGSQYPF